MKVAWQFIAWKSDHGAPSRRVRYDVTTWRLHQTRSCGPSRLNIDRRWNRANRLGKNQSHRALRDGPHLWPIPGNKLPGYDHAVPTGHSFAFGASFYSIT